MRTVPAPLQSHLDGEATTTTRLLRIETRSGFVYGLCMLDQDVTYNDGAGAVTYKATNGFDPATLSADTSYGVANSESRALLSDEIDGIDLEDVQAGELDDATYKVYLVNYLNTALGHVLLDAGDLGEVTVRHGIVFTPELLSYVMRLKQPVGSTYSRRCRAIFGTPADSQTGCGVDTDPLWVNGTVLSVGAESNRTFTGSLIIADSPGPDPEPGRVEFLTGDNAGREFAVEEVIGHQVSLNETSNYAIQVGDTYRIRPDCGKRYAEDCILRWNNGINFKGEPLIPVGDAAGIQAPGAQLGRGGGYIADRDGVGSDDNGTDGT